MAEGQNGRCFDALRGSRPVKLLRRFFPNLFKPARQLQFLFLFGAGNSTLRTNHVGIKLLSNQAVNLTAAFVDAAGVAVAPASVPAWSVSDPTVATLATSADGLQAFVSATGKLGTATVTVAADGVTATADIDVAAGPVVSATINAGNPTNQAFVATAQPQPVAA